MSTWISCSALPSVSGRSGVELAQDLEPLEPLVVLEQEQGLIHDRVERQQALLGRLRPAEIEQAVDDARAARHLAVDDLEVLRHLRGVGGARGHPAFDGGDTGADGGERIVDLVHHARGQLADRRELLALENLSLDPVPLGHVLAHRDDVGDLVAVETHRNLAEAEEPRLAAQGDLLLGLLDLAGLEHPVELRAELCCGLAGEHVEHRPADDVVPAQPLGARLPLPVPALDAVVAVHHVEAKRQAVDDQAGEAAVLLDLAGLRGHLAGEIGRELDRGEVGRQEIGDDRQHLEIRGPRPDPDLEQAQPRALVLEREAVAVGQPRDRVERAHRRGRIRRRRGLHGPEGRRARRPKPDGRRLDRQAAPESFGHGRERRLGAQPLVQELGHRADEPELSATHARLHGATRWRRRSGSAIRR